MAGPAHHRRLRALQRELRPSATAVAALTLLLDGDTGISYAELELPGMGATPVSVTQCPSVVGQAAHNESAGDEPSACLRPAD